MINSSGARRVLGVLRRRLLALTVRSRNPFTNIYHCCVQKSASQWIRKILDDPVVFRNSGLSVFVPSKDYMGVQAAGDLNKPFPERTFVSPLYVRREDFEGLGKPREWRAFWVMRDPRDLVVSRYFSLRNSHPVINENAERERRRLVEMGTAKGIAYLIEAMDRNEYYRRLYSSLSGWMQAGEDPRIRIFRYEDLVGQGKGEVFAALFSHCGIPLTEGQIAALLDRYSFEKLSGRRQGETDEKSHYRKGVVGDWKNHFDKRHRSLFREKAGGLLVELGYEKDDKW